MVGAGIFALMGEAAAVAGSAVWVSFLMAGIIALLTGHSFVELGVRYPTRGGIVEYLVRAYGVGIFSGGCSILYYIAQLIGMAMIAMAFGKFASKLIGIEENLELWDQVFASGLILVLVILTLAGSTLIRNHHQPGDPGRLRHTALRPGWGRNDPGRFLAGNDPPAGQPGADLFCLYRVCRDQQRSRADGQT
jgi:hypothetical protein